MEVVVHPLAETWLSELVAEAGLEVLGEVMALIAALEEHGRALGDPESHPIRNTSLDLHALRRTPPSMAAPFATGPPVLRVLYGYLTAPGGHDVALIVVGGDKTVLGNDWYPANVTQAEDRLADWCRKRSGYKQIVKRGGFR